MATILTQSSTPASQACQHAWPAASLSAFQLSLPFSSCPVALCEAAFRQELCRALRSDEPHHPADESPGEAGDVLISCLAKPGSVLKAREAGVLTSWRSQRAADRREA
jgi:hypothetical protein